MRSLWLTQKMIGELFGVESHTINYHIQEIYKSNELSEGATARNFRVVQNEGKREVERNIIFYNLDVIISVGYRVNSIRATQFRQWATGVLRDFAIRGYVLDKERLKNGSFLGKEYFDYLRHCVDSVIQNLEYEQRLREALKKKNKS
jgi:Virulence protein